MVSALARYLDSIRDYLRLDPQSEREVTGELETHIEDEIQELKGAGLSEEEASNTCIRLLGSAKLISRQIYEAHSQGSWRQALLASMPHLLFGLLFALNWWQGVGWLLVMLILVLSMVYYGWCHGKPIWLFPWLGYSLLPVVIASVPLLYLPKGWCWLAIILYIPLASWLLWYVTVQTIKRDWLYSSLMLLPVPTIIGWFLTVQSHISFLQFSLESLYRLAPWIGLSFLVLGVTVVLFIRLRQRWLKVSVLFISGLITLIMAAFYAEGSLNVSTLLILVLLLSGLFLAPALLDRKVRHIG